MRYLILPLLLTVLFSCKQSSPSAEKTEAPLIDSQTRIVSLSGTFTEILCAAGYEKNIVGVDVTSTYPPSMAALPKVGHNRNIQTEGILSLSPDLVIGNKRECNPEIVNQLQQAGIKVLLFDQDYTVEGARELITKLTDTLGKSETGKEMIAKINKDLEAVTPLPYQPKVLFIYARGTKTLLVSGTGTMIDAMIRIAGAQNAMTSFENFKPLNSESLIMANPDVILLFSNGLESLDGMKGLLGISGIQATKAAKNNAVISMDDQLLSGFGPRLGQAAAELNSKLKALATHE